MKRKLTLALAVAALALLPPVVAKDGGPTAEAAPATIVPQVFVTDFEDEQARNLWTAGGDAAEIQSLTRVTGGTACPANRPAGAYGALSSFDPEHGSEARAAEGNRHLPLATWAEARYAVSGGGLVDVKVEWSARNVSSCAGCTPAIYIDGTSARNGADFDYAGTLTDGWQRFEHETRVDLTGTDKLFVALGWMGGNATVGLDCITVTVTQLLPGPTRPVAIDNEATSARIR